MITVVVGAQYGGEGKGKVCAYLAQRDGADVACRCGGPNSSHTVLLLGRQYRLRMMPAAAAVNRDIRVYFGAGALIHIPTLRKEIAELKFQGTLYIDPNAGIITDDIVNEQRRDPLYQHIGSTLTGTGLATALRARRRLPLASQYQELAPNIKDVSELLWLDIRKSKRIIVEGHQGYGLSNYHGDYPYTSSRDSTAPAMLSELGIGPLQKQGSLRIVLVAKVFPTRNHAGSLGEELLEAEATALGINEYGGGSWGIPDRKRRVALFDLALVRKAVIANSPSEFALTGVDYLDHSIRGQRTYLMTQPLRTFLRDLERVIPKPKVRYISTGPATDEMFEIYTPSEGRHVRPKVTPDRDLFS